MKQNSIKGRVTEFFAFSYFNWLIVVPLLIPWVIFRVEMTEPQFWVWFADSFIMSLMIGWWTIKVDNRFQPWFYKKMGWKSKTHICAKCGEKS